jgi:hypothetical protein
VQLLSWPSRIFHRIINFFVRKVPHKRIIDFQKLLQELMQHFLSRLSGISLDIEKEV